MTGRMEGSLVTDKISVVLQYSGTIVSDEDFMFKVNIILSIDCSLNDLTTLCAACNNTVYLTSYLVA